jgi:hypothetical protein
VTSGVGEVARKRSGDRSRDQSAGIELRMVGLDRDFAVGRELQEFVRVEAAERKARELARGLQLTPECTLIVAVGSASHTLMQFDARTDRRD